MVGKKVSPPHRPYSQGNPSKVIFRDGNQSSPGWICHACCKEIFAEGKNEYNAKQTLDVHMSKTRVTGLAIFVPHWDSWSRRWSKNNLRGISIGNSMTCYVEVFGNNTASDISKLSKIPRAAKRWMVFGKFWNITSRYYCQMSRTGPAIICL